MAQPLAQIFAARKPAAPMRFRAVPPIQAAQTAPSVPIGTLASWSDLFGPYVDRPYTVSAERAMRNAAVYACVRLIAGTIAQVPLKTYRDTRDGVPIEDSTYPLAPLLRIRPNPHMTATVFWRTLFVWALLTGNGYAWIRRKRSGEPFQLWPLPPGYCQPQLTKNHALVYIVTLDDGSQFTAYADDVLHIPGGIEWNGLQCKSPLASAASSINLALEADLYAQLYFTNDATPPGYLKYEHKVSPQLAELIRQEWQKLGTGENRGKVRVVSEGGTFEQLKVNAQESQLIETRRFQIEDIARIYGVPPHMIGAVDKTTSWGTGIEQMSIGFVTFTLAMHANAAEQEIEIKIFGVDSNHHAEFDLRALMRGDSKARGDAYRQAIGGSAGPGWMTRNEIRQLENLAPVADGDEFTDWPAKTEEPSQDTDDEAQQDSQSASPKPNGADASAKGRKRRRRSNDLSV